MTATATYPTFLTIVALGSPSERSAEALSLVETALLSLWTRASNQPNAADGLASALRYMTGLFRADNSEFVDWRSESSRIGLQRFYGLLQVCPFSLTHRAASYVRLLLNYFVRLLSGQS